MPLLSAHNLDSQVMVSVVSSVAEGNPFWKSQIPFVIGLCM